VEVIAQLKFPPILRIDSEAPAAFQDTIRTVYPQYADVPQPPPGLPANVPPQIANMMQGFGGVRLGGSRHRFASQDGKWEAFLTRESLELKTTDYDRWENFRDRIAQLRDSLERLYAPSIYLRIGLRYVDVFRRSKLGLQDVPWSDLLKPSIAGVLASPDLAPGIDALGNQSHCRLEGNSFLTLRTGIVKPAEGEDAEQCFLIDCDYHTHQPTEIANATARLDEFNQTAGKFFRWCIEQRLHTAMEPGDIN
jgi:uncharacterized protein (TIGR04255 family)